ncbi:MAG: glycosyltransferase family 39 protein [Chloroflexi bacterium]|nr:glycosyltransferase family 39 protein [Chloroflexota bacterium]
MVRRTLALSSTGNHNSGLRSGTERLLGQVAALSPFRASLLVFVLSVVAKLGFIEVFGGGLGTFPTEGSDAVFYDRAARNLLANGVFGYIPGQPTTAMPPGQPYFLAFLYSIGNESMVVAKLGQVVLLSAAVVLVYLIGKNLAGPTIGFVAATLTAIDPAQAYLSGTFLSEPLFIFLMTFAVLLLVLSRNSSSLLWPASAGVFLGLAGLTRNEGWLFALALCLGAAITRGRILSIRKSVVALVASLCLIVPWIYRDYVVTGQFVPVASNGGLNLWSGNNPDFEWRQPVPMSLPVYKVPSGLNELQVDQYYRQAALSWIAANPAQFLVNGVEKVIVLFSFDPLSRRSEMSGLYRLAGLVPYGVLLPFIFVGLASAIQEPRYWLLLWYVVFTTALAFVLFGDSRIRAPIQPYLYLSGVLGVQATWRWLYSRRERRTWDPDQSTVDRL